MAKLPRSTFYYQAKVSAGRDSDKKLITKIKSIYHRHKGRYGYRRITLALNKLEGNINHKRVLRLMRLLGLKSLVRPKKYRLYKGTVGRIAPDKLQRQFYANEPNQKWVTDITEFKVKGEKLYLSPVMDLYNGEIIAYQTSHRPVLPLVTKMLKKVFKRLTIQEKPLLHSDQGWHYQHNLYRQALKDEGLTQSMSRKGNCLDNAAIESFFGTLKSEFFTLTALTRLKR